MAVARFATHLWYDDKAEEAAQLYTRLLPDSQIDRVTRAPEGIPGTEPGSGLACQIPASGVPRIARPSRSRGLPNMRT